MKLSIITISYNTAELTCQTLSSLVAVTDMQIGHDFEVIVVDNGSTDDSVQRIKTEFPQVKLVQTGENLGFSRGNNVGLAHTDKSSRYVLFLNSDTVVPDYTLTGMIDYMENNSSVGVATCRVDLVTKFRDYLSKTAGSDNYPADVLSMYQQTISSTKLTDADIRQIIDWDCHRGFPTPWVALTKLLRLNKIFPRAKIFNQYNQSWQDLTQTHGVDAVVGAFMLVPREIGEKIGWWDEDYFLNGEDIDFCYRVKELVIDGTQQKYQVIYYPHVSILHYRGASKGTRKESKKFTKASTDGKRLVAASSVSAMQLFYDKHLREDYPNVINYFVDFGLKILKWKRTQLK